MFLFKCFPASRVGRCSIWCSPLFDVWLLLRLQSWRILEMAALYASSAVGIGIICAWRGSFLVPFHKEWRWVICQWIESVLVTKRYEKGVYIYIYMNINTCIAYYCTYMYIYIYLDMCIWDVGVGWCLSSKSSHHWNFPKRPSIHRWRWLWVSWRGKAKLPPW